MADKHQGSLLTGGIVGFAVGAISVALFGALFGYGFNFGNQAYQDTRSIIGGGPQQAAFARAYNTRTRFV